jgi:hypothetical protein
MDNDDHRRDAANSNISFYGQPGSMLALQALDFITANVTGNHLSLPLTLSHLNLLPICIAPDFVRQADALIETEVNFLAGEI